MTTRVWMAVIFAIVGCYVSVSWMVFAYRNPTANEAAVFRHFVEVVTWERMQQYQTGE